jgi:alcohol dehydrogenase class IV
MVRPVRLHGAAALIAAGVAGDRAPGPALSSPSAMAATSMTRPAAIMATPGAATAGTVLDALTERAFAVTSPSVVYVFS